MNEGPEVYNSVESMEPLLPASARGRLAEITCQILIASGNLVGQIHAPLVREKVAGLVRAMNCYYSNLIEGQKTMPRDIERALKQDFSSDPEKRNNQQLSISHIAVESRLASKLREENVSPYSPEFICWLHEEFYRGLPEALHWAKTKSGKRYHVEAGVPRDFMVDVGSHTPPHFAAIPAFLRRFCEGYGSAKIYDTERLVAVAAAHHRLAWIHPFGDGNGRVVRLHSQALLIHHGMDGGGLWTLSRGLARARQRYYDLLSNADQKRAGDFDGRGNLSDKALGEFCQFFLETMLDQIKYMGSLLDLPSLRTRIKRYFQFEALDIVRYKEELMRIVRVLADEGEIPRARVLEITGKSGATVAEIIKHGLARGLFSSPSAKGPLQVAFPEKILPFYFPQLFIDLPVESRESDA
ncbi:Fic family protein [soil metagenome]